MTDEELDELLKVKPVAADSLQKADLLNRSKQQLPRPARWPWVVAALCLFASGLLVGWFAKPPVIVQVPAEPSPIQYETVPVPIVIPPEPQPQGPTYYTAVELDKMEQAAELADPPKAAQIYQELGDYYLDQQDLYSATRCYRLVMNNLPRSELTMKPNDSWLLIDLKAIRRKEQSR
jgi:hypothetical protein